ncbi:MAG: hypothetical protein CVV02_14225 [Firmicutes bacterium HGW-Firmicutes-7]|nr:MAG: hypothetical protein CVV02_14225 [Firmicutes bacterium HGW-Firmicutes-7]
MRNSLFILLIVTFIILLTSCNQMSQVIDNDINTNVSVDLEENPKEEPKEQLNDKIIDDVQAENSSELDNTTVEISGYYSEPQSINNPDTLVLESGVGGEYVEVIIAGEIYDFELISLIWDDEKNILVEDELIKYFDKVSNQIIIIKTHMPEGIPVEKMKWKSSSGKAYEFIIRESGGELGKEGNIHYFELD